MGSVRRHALVIGAGVAGPAVALFLSKVGITSTVYEAHADRPDAGGGLVLAPNGMNVLAELGLAERVKARGTLALENRFYTEAGRRLARFSNGGDRYGQPAVALMRDDLRDVMLSELAARSIPVRTGRRLAEVASDDGTKIVARFTDGTTAEGDVLVGADGVQSRARAAVFPEATAPSFLGAVGVGGLTPGAAVPKLTTADKQSLSFTFGARGLFCYCGTRGGDVMWWTNLCRARPLDGRPLEDREALGVELRQEMLDLFRGYHAPIATLIEHAGAPTTLDVFEVEPLRRWHAGRVVLVGDAAHAVSPSSGQGASLALEDAMDLGRRLRDDGGDHARAFEGFERDRRARVERIASRTHRDGTDKAEITPLRSQVRHFALWLALNLFGERSQDWVYRYRVDWGPVASR